MYPRLGLNSSSCLPLPSDGMTGVWDHTWPKITLCHIKLGLSLVVKDAHWFAENSSLVPSTQVHTSLQLLCGGDWQAVGTGLALSQPITPFPSQLSRGTEGQTAGRGREDSLVTRSEA